MSFADERRLPFFMVTKPACRALERHFRGRRLPVARSIYFALVELANDARTVTEVTKPRRAIAERAGVNVRVVDEYAPELEAAGVLRVDRVMVEGVNHPNRWIITDPPVEEVRGSAGGSDPDVPTLAAQDRGGSDPACTPFKEEGEPDGSPEEDKEARAAAPARKSVSYRGRRVPATTVRHAEQLLGIFGQAVGRSAPAWTGAGEPTPALKQVVGALKAREEVTASEWEAAIRAFAASPPAWVDGPLQLGHVFGERAAEHALAAGRSDTVGHSTNGRTVNGRRDFSMYDAVIR